MNVLLLALTVVFSAIQPPQGNAGVLSGRVTRPGGAEGIAGVQITLQGPVATGPGYVPNAALTPEMRAQVDSLIASVPPGVSPEVIANAAARLEAQLLGLPLPPPLAGPAGIGTGNQPAQIFSTTDADGRFTIRNLAAGQYQVRAQREGYFGATAPGTLGAPGIVLMTANVVAGKETAGVAIQMVRGATVSGRVRDPNGQPIASIQVTAYQWTYREGRPTLALLNSKTSDDRGEFRLFWLPPGDYIIGVVPPRPTTVPRPTDGYAKVYFPNATDPRFAAPVTASEGMEMTGIDIGIRGMTTVTVSGQVVNNMAGANVQMNATPALYLLPRDSNAVLDPTVPNFPNVAANRDNGQFELRGVPPGSYDLVATATDSTGRPFPGRTPIVVGYNNLDNVVVTIRPGVEVKARILLDGTLMSAPPMPAAPAVATTVRTVDGGTVVTQTAPPPAPPPAPPVVALGQRGMGAGVRLQLRSKENYALPFDNIGSSNVTTDASGAIVFPNAPEGLYSIQVSGLPPNGYVADIQENGVSIYDGGLRITTQPPGPIDVLLNTNGAAIQGVVQNPTQQPVEGATVVLVPAAVSKRQNAALYKTARSNAQGVFRLTAVPPGDYKLFAWDAIAATAFMNAEFLAPYETRGTAISAPAGSSLEAQLVVIPGRPSR